MKLKPVEIIASALAAVAAAAVASVFGVKGTLVGAAIGSAVASSVAAVVSQSVHRTREVVRKAGITVVARHSTATTTVGDVEASERLSSPIADHEAGPSPQAETAPVGEPDPGEPRRDQRATSDDTGALADAERSMRRWRLTLLGVGSALAAFLLALGILTIVEVGAGRSLSSIFGGPKAGTTVGGFFSPPRSSTTTSVPSTTTTTAVPSSTTVAPTTTTQPGQTTTTTAPTSGTTTTSVGVSLP